MDWTGASPATAATQLHCAAHNEAHGGHRQAATTNTTNTTTNNERRAKCGGPASSLAVKRGGVQKQGRRQRPGAGGKKLVTSTSGESLCLAPAGDWEDGQYGLAQVLGGGGGGGGWPATETEALSLFEDDHEQLVRSVSDESSDEHRLLRSISGDVLGLALDEDDGSPLSSRLFEIPAFDEGQEDPQLRPFGQAAGDWVPAAGAGGGEPSDEELMDCMMAAPPEHQPCGEDHGHEDCVPQFDGAGDGFETNPAEAEAAWDDGAAGSFLFDVLPLAAELFAVAQLAVTYRGECR